MAAMTPEVAIAIKGKSGSSHGGGRSSQAVTAAVALMTLPLIAVTTVLLVLAGGAGAMVPDTGCGGGTVGTVALDGEQIVNARTILGVAAGRGLPVFAGVVAIATSYTEAALHNSTVETDHDSEGLFQQRISIYTRPVADDPVKATNAFLDRLIGITGWQTNTVGVDAQTVQSSRFPNRYQSNADLAGQLVGHLWPRAAATTSAAATAIPAPGSSPLPVTRRNAGNPIPRVTGGASPTTAAGPVGPAGATGPVLVAPPATAPATTPATTPVTAPVTVVPCTGGGDPSSPVGGTGNNVAGQVTIPAGFVVTGSAQGQAAVAFALTQLGKAYVYGAAGPDTWDCSGLTMGAWSTQGIALAHYTGTQAQEGAPEPVDLSGAVGGDLLLIPGADGTAAVPGHVGMIAGTSPGPGGRTETWIVQAPMTGIPVELTDATEWAGQIVDVRHIA